MRCSKRQFGLAVALIVVSAHVIAQIEAEVGIQTRYFSNGSSINPAHELLTSANMWILAESATNEALFSWVLELFGRYDSADQQRTHGDVRRALLRFKPMRSASLELGLGREFWGVAESNHLVNIINQLDLVEEPDAEELLGQPMLKWQQQLRVVTWTTYLLPGFRKRVFHDAGDRLSIDPKNDVGQPRFESDAGSKHLDWATRLNGRWHNIDAGFSYFEGTSREPRLIPLTNNGFRPYYEQIRQASLDVQYTAGSWLWKLEAIYRDGQHDRFSAWVAGFENTWFGIFGSGSDLGWIVEYLHDDRDQQLSPPSSFDNDLFIGCRWQANDLSDSSLLLGIFVDLDSDEQFVKLEFFNRVGDRFTASLEANLPLSTTKNTPLFFIRNDGFISATLSIHGLWGE